MRSLVLGCGLRLLSAQSVSRSGAAVTRCLSRSAQLASMIKVGDKLPAATLYEDSPANSVNTADLCKGKVVMFGVPGAFTPGCSQTHLPGYVQSADKMRADGVDQIVCVAVNDPFVTGAWAKEQGAAGKVRILSDVQGDLTRAMGLELDLKAVLGTMRCKRFSMLLQDGVVQSLEVEPDGKGLTCSLADVIAKKLAAKK